MQEVGKSMFERAFHAHLNERVTSKIPGPKPAGKDLPLFYISMGLAVLVYVALLVAGPSNAGRPEWFASIGNPNLHPGMSLAQKASASEKQN